MQDTFCDLQNTAKGRRWSGDKYGKAYFEARESAVGLGRLRDRHVVFASADRATSDRMAAEFPPSEYGGRLHIVDSSMPSTA